MPAGGKSRTFKLDETARKGRCAYDIQPHPQAKHGKGKPNPTIDINE